jgi:hypothetical protein
VRSSGQRGVTGCGRPFRGFRWVWAIRRLLVTAADESGVSRWLASCGMRAGRYRLVLAGKGPVRRLVAWAAFRRQGGLPGKAGGETGAASGLMRVHVSSVGGRGFSREWGAVFVDDCRCAAWTSSVRGMAMNRGNSAGIEKERGP